MNEQEALVLLKQSLIEHKLTDWSGTLDNARRRFGMCRMDKKLISLSRYLCELNSEAEVRDTILHEIAHALAWERHAENCGHDKRWQAICIEIGARPVACFDDEVIQPQAPWVLVHRDTDEVYRTYFKRPSRDWSGLWIRGRKAETFGKLVIRANQNTPATADLFPDDSQREQPGSVLPENNSPKNIERFSAQSVAEFRLQLLEHTRVLAAQFGLDVSNGKGRFSDTSCDLTLTFSLPDTRSAEDIQRLEFETQAGVFGLQKNHYLNKFTVNGREFSLVGFKLNNRKYPVIGIDESGQKYKFEKTVLEQITG